MHRLIRLGLVVAVLSTACGTDEGAVTTTSMVTTTTTPVVTTTTSSSTTTSSTTTTTTLAPIEYPYVEINGARLVYRCAGEGLVSILIDQGLSGPGSNTLEWENFNGWERVVADLEEHAQVCIYNRQGVAGSDMVRTSAALRTTEDQVNDLVGVIAALELNTPVVLIGHSIAGFNLVLLADRYPDLVGGMVFADASTAAQITFGDGACCATAPEYLDISTSAGIVGQVESLGDIPIYVLTAGQMTTDEWGEDWLRVQTDLAAMSSVSRHDVVPSGKHLLFGTSPDEIAAAALWVIEQADFDS